MNLESIKTDFAIYLENLKTKEGSNSKKYENVGNSEYNIFEYQNEFKDFISDEFTGSDVQSMSVSEILDMEVVNGKLMTEEEFEEYEKSIKGDDKSEKEDEAKAEGETKAADGTDAQPTDGEAAAQATDGAQADSNPVKDLLNEFVENEDLAKFVDADGDSEITDDEIESLVDALKGLDGDDTNLSIEDLLTGAEKLLSGTVETLSDLLGDVASEVEDALKTPETESANNANSAQQASSTPCSSSGNSVGSSGGNYTGGNSVSNNQNQEKTLDNMSIEELKTELNKSKDTLGDKQSALDEITSGENPELKGLQENIDKAYKDYQEQLKNVDEDLAKKVDDQKKLIDDKKKEINDKDKEINDCETSLSEAKNNYSNAQANTKTLKATRDALNNTDTSKMDEKGKSAIAEKKASIEKAIAKAEKAEEDAKKKVEDTQTKLDGLKKDKTNLEGELNTLNEDMATLEKEVSEKYPQIQEYMDAYKDAQEEYDTTKDSMTTQAKAEVTEAQNHVNEVQTALSAAETKKEAAKYSPNEYNAEAGNKLLDSAKRNLRGTRGMCLGGVNDALQGAYGQRLGFDYAYQAADALAGNVKGYENLASNFKEVDVSRNELGSLPPGCIVVWERNNASAGAAVAGHISITAGNGTAYSDHYESPMHYLNSSVGYRVFQPVS